MEKAYIFWTLMLLWAVGILGMGAVPEPYRNRVWIGGGLLLFILLGLLGWQVFGQAVK